ncbi:MAG TPA: glycosyltransferase family 4 protein [Candidatus Saccharimonadales bacterium]|nr:glycosyltransferase family 4 protein [Candidatus Saccharimonadales bacterium]
MKNTRIILIRNAMSYDFGGGERFPVFLAERLKAEGLDPLIISRSPKLLDFAKSRFIQTKRGWWWSWQNWSGVRIFLTPLYFCWQLILFFWYLQLFIRVKPAVVHAQGKDDFIAATFAASALGIRVVWTDHADLKHIWKNIRVWYKNPIGKLVHAAAKRSNVVTLVSESERSLVAANLKDNDPVLQKMTVVYNGSFDYAGEYPHSKNKHFIFVVVSRLVIDKGIREVIDAFTDVQKEHPASELWLIGDGPDEATLRDYAKDRDHIQFLGYQKDPLSFMARADVFVHPTYHEGFSVALVEASMLSLPIIATNVGGNGEIIRNEETGLLVPAQNVDALSAAMARLSTDPKLGSELGARARNQYEQKFDFARIVHDRFIPLYEGRNS